MVLNYKIFLPKSVSRTPKIQSGCNKANELRMGVGENVNYSVTTLYLNSYITEHFVMSVN